jgi:hypothetical protein
MGMKTTWPLEAAPIHIDRAELVNRMAADLIEADAFRDESDAVRLLYFKGYGTMRVCLLAGEACYLAKQAAIAREMSQP